MILVGVRYCGGCNPRHDRVGFVTRLSADCPDIRLEPALPGTLYDRLLVVCGCPARCANYSSLESSGGVFIVASDTDYPRAKEFVLKGTS